MMDTATGTGFVLEALDELVTDLDLVEFLHRLTEVAVGAGHASAVGTLLADARGRLRYVAASDGRAELLETLQLGLDAGPCPEAYRLDRDVEVDDLETGGERWPEFARVARAAGFRAVHAVPVRLDGRPIGAMGYFGPDAGDVAGEDRGWIAALANLVAVAVVTDDAPARADHAARRVQNTLRDRIVVEQAAGAVAELEAISVGEASALLRAHARRHGRHLASVAADVVASFRHESPWWRA